MRGLARRIAASALARRRESERARKSAEPPEKPTIAGQVISAGAACTMLLMFALFSCHVLGNLFPICLVFFIWFYHASGITTALKQRCVVKNVTMGVWCLRYHSIFDVIHPLTPRFIGSVGALSHLKPAAGAHPLLTILVSLCRCSVDGVVSWFIQWLAAASVVWFWFKSLGNFVSSF